MSIIGVILNIKHKRVCFVIWFGTNFAWMVIDWVHGIQAQAALMAVYWVLAIWGLIEWSKKKHVG